MYFSQTTVSQPVCYVDLFEFDHNGGKDMQRRNVAQQIAEAGR